MKQIDCVISNKKHTILRNLLRSKYLILLLLPASAYLIIFNYVPMYGILMAFKEFNPMDGIVKSPWIGFKWFEQFFSSVYFGRLIKNTVFLSLYSLVWGFPVPIIFALLLNEVKNYKFKRIVQTISYLPYFVSVVIIVGIMFNVLNTGGTVQTAIQNITGLNINFVGKPEWFRTLYISSGIYQSFGFSAIIYLAALSTINPELYDSARIDGAGRFKVMVHVNLPGIMPTIITLFILSVGNLFSVGFEKIILMYSPATYKTADVISTYVYRTGILNGQYELGVAIGLFNTLCNVSLLLCANWLCRKMTDYSLF